MLDHTADIGLEASGPDLTRAFEEAAAGMFSLIVDPATVEQRVRRDVSVTASDTEDLLMSWLNELLYLHEAEGLVLSGFRIEEWDRRTRLRATVAGEPYDTSRHELELGIKACTFNGLVVEAGPPARLTVYFDI